MDFLWDTVFLMHYLQNSDSFRRLNAEFDFFSPDHRIFLSIVSAADLYAHAWEAQRSPETLQELQTLLNKFTFLPIDHEDIRTAYATISAYNQGNYPTKPLPLGVAPHQMDSHHRWIAATAHVFHLTLVTASKHFDHLHRVFLQCVRV